MFVNWKTLEELKPNSWVIILAEESPVWCTRVHSLLMGCPFMNMYPYTGWKKTRPADEKDVPLYNCLSAKVLCKYPALLLALLFGIEAFYFPLCHWIWTRLMQWQKPTVFGVTFVFLHVGTLGNSITFFLKRKDSKLHVAVGQKPTDTNGTCVNCTSAGPRQKLCL